LPRQDTEFQINEAKTKRKIKVEGRRGQHRRPVFLWLYFVLKTVNGGITSLVLLLYFEE
jgi:hypothetical protein